MTEKNEKPSIEQQVAEWSATDAALREAVEATEGLTGGFCYASTRRSIAIAVPSET